MPGGKWDQAMKRLIQAVAHDIVCWLIPGALIVRALSTELHSRNVLADELYEVIVGEQTLLLHIELQSRRDGQMAERLLEYNVLATRRYNKRVISCVIYLLDDGTVPVSPLVWRGLDEEVVLLFAYRTIELWKLRAEDLLGLGLPGVLPLLPLTQEGRDHGVIEQMIEGVWRSATLDEEQKRELLSQAYSIASLVLTQQDERGWLRRRFEVFLDLLRTSWVYEEWKEEGREQGREEGREQGIQEGLHRAVLMLVETHFPELLPRVRELIPGIQDEIRLQRLIVNMSIARTIEEAEGYLALDEGR